MNRARLVLAVGLTLVGCGSSSELSNGASSGAGASDAGGADGRAKVTGGDDAGGTNLGVVGTNVRGQRFCEALLAQVSGDQVHVDVYNTYGLNDCPDALWSALDATALAKELGVTQVLLYGPRYWTIDGVILGAYLDPAPKTLGGIAMRRAGIIDIPLSSLSTLGTPYVTYSVQRQTLVKLSSGKRIYELVGPHGHVYEMQSYSTQKTMQSDADLASLGDRLSLPLGWSYRSRVLDTELEVQAVDGVALVVQDELGNTYQQ